MPLIAPIWGLGNPPWAMTWKKVAEAVSLDFANFAKGAIPPGSRRFREVDTSQCHVGGGTKVAA